MAVGNGAGRSFDLSIMVETTAWKGRNVAMLQHPERWGRLQSRYEDENRPRKLLALDGGGIRGLITLGILKGMEDLLANKQAAPKKFRLCQYFDYIAGTSTGAIIAAGLARGMSVQELIDFYRRS